ncbi:MAG: recombinase family protein [Caloramator sp.]|nr:recombinase family protein [Caloramator sp.]
MKKVAIYCRLSDEDKNKENELDNSESIENQRSLLIKYANDNGWQIYDIYVDDDYSGLDRNRPDFNRMIKDAENHCFDIILCKHQSRFTRDMELVEKYLHNKFIEWGIRFISVVDGVDNFDKFNKKSRQINGLINEWYCEDISESIKAVFKIKQERGDYIGSFAPYGYKKDKNNKNRLIIDEEAAKVVRMIFYYYLDGNGTQHIARILNEKGIPNPTMYKKMCGYKYINPFITNEYGLWNKTTVKRILRNKVYIGSVVQHKIKKLNYKSDKAINLKPNEWIIVEGKHEPIIDKKIFNLVQEKLDSNIRNCGIGIPHIFAGKLRCMDCKSTMTKTTNGAGSTYFRCSLYATSKNLCSNHSIKYETLVETVSQKLHYYINLFCNENSINKKLEKDKIINDNIIIITKERDKIIGDITERKNAVKALYLDKVRGSISEEQFTELNKIFCNEIEQLTKRKESLDKEIEDLTKKNRETNNFIFLINKYKNFTELTYSMVNELINYIEIGEKNSINKEQKIVIHWNF